MSYENAKSTKLLATNCAVCCRPLRDAVSVELGIGPDCRAKYGFNIEVPEEARATANKLVHLVAVSKEKQEIADAIKGLHDLNFHVLAEKLAERISRVHVKAEGDVLRVWAPFQASFVAAVKAIPGRKYDGHTKTWSVPSGKRMKLMLHAALCDAFPGQWAYGPNGLFRLPVKQTIDAAV